MLLNKLKYHYKIHPDGNIVLEVMKDASESRAKGEKLYHQVPGDSPN